MTVRDAWELLSNFYSSVEEAFEAVVPYLEALLYSIRDCLVMTIFGSLLGGLGAIPMFFIGVFLAFANYSGYLDDAFKRQEGKLLRRKKELEGNS